MMLSKDEARATGRTRYFTGKACPRGHVSERHLANGTCVTCSAERVTEWRKVNRKRANATARRQQSAPEAKLRQKEWLRRDRTENPDKYTENMRRWYFANKDRARELAANWRNKNRAKLNAKLSENRKVRELAVPSWLTSEHRAAIFKFYEEATLKSRATGIKHSVDHIVPLMGKHVCGLHVPWNLQVLTLSENCKKKNKFVV